MTPEELENYLKQLDTRITSINTRTKEQGIHYDQDFYEGISYNMFLLGGMICLITGIIIGYIIWGNILK